jgi:hypothetical protein
MMFQLVKRWWRWRVYQLGHGGWHWIGTFADREHAHAFMQMVRLGPMPHDDPVNDQTREQM